MVRVVLFSFLLSLMFACGGDSGGEAESQPTPEGQTAGDCTDRADNDGDGDFDCADSGCAGSPDCQDSSESSDTSEPSDASDASDSSDPSDGTDPTDTSDGTCVDTEDVCGVCDGDGSSCADCAGVPNGDSVEDACGVCDGDGSSCADCAGVPNGDSVEDACGVCDGDGSSCAPPEGFVLIEAGTFTMGSPESELGHESNWTDETQHQVTLTNDFYMSDHEVTQAEWQALIGNNPSGKHNGTCDTCPVETVTWWETLHYANALSESEGLTACYVLSSCNDYGVCTGVTLQDGSGNTVTTPYECQGYRLPTEAEWEYAARSGTTTAFYNGDITTEFGLDRNAYEIAWYDSNSGNTTHAVKGKLPNAWGLYDMSGNVAEWTWDWYGSYSGDATDPTGPSSGSGRVLRGGGWRSNAGNVRVASRANGPPGVSFDFLGFRLARTVQ